MCSVLQTGDAEREERVRAYGVEGELVVARIIKMFNVMHHHIWLKSS